MSSQKDYSEGGGSFTLLKKAAGIRILNPFSFSHVFRDAIQYVDWNALSLQIEVYDFSTQRHTCRVNAHAGPITCLNLRDSPEHMFVTGGLDRK